MQQKKKLIISKNNAQLKLFLMSSSKCIDTVEKLISIEKKDVVGTVIDPHEFLYLVRSSINEIMVKNSKHKIGDIEIVGDMNALLFCDKITTTALTPAFVLTDNRAINEYKSLKKTSFAKKYIDICQQDVSLYSWFCFLKWFQKSGQNLYNINLKNCFCMTLENYLLINLTNKKENILDICTASSSGLFDYFNNELSKTIIKELDIPFASLPKVNSTINLDCETSGFVPLGDNIPISSMTNQDYFRWNIMPKKGFGAFNIHFLEDEILIHIFIGDEPVKVKKGCQKVVFSDEKVHCTSIKEIIKISNIQSDLIQKTFKDIVCEHRQFENENTWMVFNEHTDGLSNQFAIINLNQSDNKDNILDAYLEGVFHLIKMKLNQFQQFYEIDHVDIFCTSSLDLDETVLEMLCNCIQTPLLLINLKEISLTPNTYFKNSKQPQKKEGPVSKKKSIVKFFMPYVDPISSYARYQTWMSFYEKIFVN